MKSSDKLILARLNQRPRWARFDEIMGTDVQDKYGWNRCFSFEELKHWRELKLGLTEDDIVEELKNLLFGIKDFTPDCHYQILRSKLKAPLQGKLP